MTVEPTPAVPDISRSPDPAGPVRAWPALRYHQLFEAVADRQPTAPVILSDHASPLTYRDLDLRANVLAHALIGGGIGREEAVGVLTSRSALLPLAFLAILKAGGAYVPMGADLPPLRLAEIARQAGMRRLIALDGLDPPAAVREILAARAGEGAGTVLRPETVARDGGSLPGGRPNLPGSPSDLAVILFTSGSTGVPKGVLLQHESCVNMSLGHIEAQGITAADRVLLSSTPGFILGLRELCLPLLAGAAFVPASRERLDDPAALMALMSRHRVSVAMFTPSYLRLFQGKVPDGLRCLMTAGERPNADDARAYARHLAYWNIHGATEVCGTICMRRVRPDDPDPLPSGRPMTNMSVRLLDENGGEVPPGEAGEIHVIGIGVARGYLDRPDMTAERFVETRFGRAYRTNDLGRWTARGELQSIGRAGEMVKISGQSVALGEIETALSRQEAVRHAAVVFCRGRLIAFVESDDSVPVSLEAWHHRLGRTLPAYMMPSEVRRIARMPLNPSGKADRIALLALVEETRESRAGTPPQGEIEQRIAAIWQECLDCGPVLREDKFYALGGTSLLAVAVSQKLQAEGHRVTARDVLAAATIAALADRIASPAGREEDVSGGDGDDRAVSGQTDFWIARTLGLATSGAQITRILAVRGVVPPPERWAAAWAALLARHPALRTGFAEQDDLSLRCRVVAPDEPFLDVGFHLDACERDDQVAASIARRADLPFDLTRPPLARAGLVRLARGGGPLLWITVHHAVADGVSVRIIQEELFALVQGEALPPAPDGIALAAQAERRTAAGESERDAQYWRDRLDALVAAGESEAFADLPADHARPSVPAAHAATPLVERLEPEVVAALTRLAQARQVGVHALLLALLAVEAGRRTGRFGLILGTAVATRPPGADRAVGYFVNLLPLVLPGLGSDTLADRIGTAQAVLAEAVDHSSCSSGRIYRDFRRIHPDARPHSRTELCDITLTANPSRTCGGPGDAFGLTPIFPPGWGVRPAGGIDLAFSHEPADGGGIDLMLIWNPDIFTQANASAWLRGFSGWARWLAAETGRAERPPPPLLPDEAARLAGWESGPVRPRPARRAHDLFEARTDRLPDSAAVIGDGTHESAVQLDRRANRLAWRLIGLGVGREEPVAVLTECCADLPATVMGLWKAGAAYLPLAAENPPDRLARMARDAGVRRLVVLGGLAVPFPLAKAVETVLRPEIEVWTGAGDETRPAVSGSPQDLAYIIYTSGTTGTPKGVLVQHDSFINAILMSGETFGLSSADRFALVATPGFDASLWELGIGLLLGLALVPISRMLRDDPWALKSHYAAHGVTAAFHAPSYLRVSRNTPFDGMRVLLTGGEAPTHEDAACHAGRTAFWNAYGPTETTIFVSADRLPPDPDPACPLTVGRPLANLSVTLRRSDGTPVPPGVTGEAWLGGAGVARGYVNAADLTAQRFVTTAQGRFYRSGDLARWSEDGRLVIVGRVDSQIKLHGQRIELAEIERAVRAVPGIDEAVVVAEPAANGTMTLRAFIRPGSGAALPSEENWRALLAQSLPHHMIPSALHRVEAMPLTPAGKVDGAALSRLPRRGEGKRLQVPPRPGIEARIAAVWEEMLGVPVGREDNFFALGGNSLLAVAIAHRLSAALGRAVAARWMVSTPVLSAFARAVDEAAASAPARAESDRATLGQLEFWTAERAGLETSAFTIPVVRRVEGGPSSIEEWRAAWADLVACHPALRTSFRLCDEGKLRAVVASGLEPTIDDAVCPDLDTALGHIRAGQVKPFAMDTSPLWRVGRVRIGRSGETLLWIALHHAIGDGHSVGVLLNGFATRLGGGTVVPPDQTFAAAAAREQAYLAGAEAVADAAYWRRRLGALPAAAFAEGRLDYPRSISAPAGMHRFEAEIGRPAAAGLKALARAHAASLHAVMLTLLALEAGRRDGREAVMIGSPVSMRETAAEAGVVGCYVNMVPVPCPAGRADTFGAMLRGVHDALAEGLRHGRLPFARMYQEGRGADSASVGRHPARFPLFDLVVTENPDGGAIPGPVRLSRLGVACERTDVSPGQDMVLTHEAQGDGGLVLQWHVNAALFSRETALSWFRSLTGWARWLGEDIGRAESVLPPLLPEEAAWLARVERGAVAVRPPLRFNQWVEGRLDREGAALSDRPAILTPDRVVTHGELECQANIIAHDLRRRGVAAGDVVAVLTGRSPSLPAALLGVWKAGAVYLPLAADLPSERLCLMAVDAAASVLIVLDGGAVPSDLASVLPLAIRPETIDEDFRHAHAHRPPPVGRADDIAYILYTSGSTGRPKGTRVGHDSYLNTVLGAGEILELGCGDRTLMMASPSFDVSLSDIGLPLAFGAALCPVPYEVLSAPRRFLEFLAAMEVTVADITPTYLRLFDGAGLPMLRCLVTGGEAPFPADVRTYAGCLRYFNAYGPTENTITSTMGRLDPEEAGRPRAGRPLPNTSVHLVASDGTPVPPGAVGEIWLGGAGLARDYAGRPETTAAAFIETRDGRRYRSGDLGRWSESGDLDILGRCDDQVKLNGIRIEPGEIESVLQAHPAILQAAVVLEGGSGPGQSLSGFVRLEAGRTLPPDTEWRPYLARHLPASMIPAALIEVAALPLSVSGKVDRAALRSLLAAAATDGSRGKALPEAGLEQEIAAVWRDLLGRGPIHRDDDFFALGGHSLLAIAVAHRLETEHGLPVSARDLFADPSLSSFARRVAALSRGEAPSVPSSDRATEGQREFWIAEQAGLDTRGFVIPLTLRVGGVVPPPERWRAAWAVLVARHGALRTAFAPDETGILRRIVAERGTGAFDITFQSDAASALAYVGERQGMPFAMGTGPLWRAGLAGAGPGDPPLFWLALHHSVGDGISLGVLVEELALLLRGESLDTAQEGFGHSAGREEAYLDGQESRDDARYWHDTLAAFASGEDASLSGPFDEWPLDFPRPLARTEALTPGAHVFTLRLDAEIAGGLRRFAQDNGAGLHALILTLFAIETRRRTGRSDILLGTAASTRDRAVEARIVGYYVNMVPLPCRMFPSETLGSALRRQQSVLAEAMRHARYPFARLYRDLRQDVLPPSHPARYPLFDLAVTENPALSLSAKTGAAGVRFEPIAVPDGTGLHYEIRRKAPAQDMVLAHEAQPDGSLVLRWYVNAALYEAATAQAWIESLASWSNLIACGRLGADQVPPVLLPGEEALLTRWEHGPDRPLPASSLPARFAHHARHDPERLAVVTDQGGLSYAEIDAVADALAQTLIGGGVGRGQPVGVFAHRSPALPETVLAIWKAGAVYLPLSADLPPDRLAFIARDAGLRHVVVLDGLVLPGGFEGCAVFRPDSPGLGVAPSASLGVALRGEDPAYIIHTSGSTGQPKGVVLHHHGLNNLGESLAAALEIVPGDRVLLMASPAFDAWISDLAMTWAAGGAVVPVRREDIDDIDRMRERIARLGITVATMPPSYLHLFGQDDFPGLRLLMTVGEPPLPGDARHYAARLRYINGYGPTETTAAATVGPVDPVRRRLTSGRPLANISVHIRDGAGRTIAPLAIGEIWLGGAGVASGYLNRPDLTAASFVETPDGRLYRSGDLGRWTCAGDLEILGRADRQVKLRGQRVELEEIERRLESHPAARRGIAVVDARTEASPVLWAFVSLREGAADPGFQAWQDHLARTLPPYMVPSAVIVVPDIPLTVSGKIDRTALLRLVGETNAASGGPPRDAMEREIAAVWTEHLGCPPIGREADFFELGGDSLRAIAMVNRLRRTVQCSINALYEHSRLADFAALCRPRPEHLRTLIRAAAADWRSYRDGMSAYEAERNVTLGAAERSYEARTRDLGLDLAGPGRDYAEVFLTGATGYLGVHLLRDLLADPARRVTVLVRAEDDATARARLDTALQYYFGPGDADAWRDDPRLTVLAGDLRRDGLGLSAEVHERLAQRMRAVFHCAANVRHFGHYREFEADNVAATRRMLDLAVAASADFHFVSTLSVCGKAPETGFKLFSEDDHPPETLDDNYYIRTKQEAERLVVAARDRIANASIHRIGNVVFAAGGGPLQVNIAENAFFRQLGAFLRLGVVPDDSHLWPCYVDLTARAIRLLAERGRAPHQTYHIENGRRMTLAAFVPTARPCGFDAFLDRLDQVVDDPEMSEALTGTMETFGLYRGTAPQPNARRIEITSRRTQRLLGRLGLFWPLLPSAGHADMLRGAGALFTQKGDG